MVSNPRKNINKILKYPLPDAQTRRIGPTRRVQILTRRVESGRGQEKRFSASKTVKHHIQLKPIMALIPLMGFGHKNFTYVHIQPYSLDLGFTNWTCNNSKTFMARSKNKTYENRSRIIPWVTCLKPSSSWSLESQMSLL
mgnify:CR=1 FL=1